MLNRRPSSIPPNGNGSNGALSPARAALAKHLAEIQWLSERVDQLDKPRRDLALAEQAERDATLALEAVGDMEAADLKAWSKTASGPYPAPRAREREAATNALCDAHTNAEAVRRAAGTVKGDYDNALQKLAAMHGQLKPLVRDVIIEEVLRLRADWVELRRSEMALRGAMFGLRDSLLRAGDTPGAEMTMYVTSTGCLPPNNPHANELQYPPQVDVTKLPKNTRVMEVVGVGKVERTATGEAMLFPSSSPVINKQFDPRGSGPMGFLGSTPPNDYFTASAQATTALAQELAEIGKRNERRAMALLDVLARDPHATLEIDAEPEKLEDVA